MDFQNYFYTFAQIIHNFGAVIVVSCALFSQFNLFRSSIRLQDKLAWFSLVGWTAQGLSGLAFGTISYYYHGKFPDIHGIANAALLVKMACTSLGILLAIYYLRSGDRLLQKRRNVFWKTMVIISSIALTAAAFLRWFS